MQLAEGTRRVATGDFMPIREFQGGDEINVLTRSFNSMIKEVSEARRGLELQRLQAEARHAGHVLAGGEHAEHGALLLQAVGTLPGKHGRAHAATSFDASSTAAAASGPSCAPSSP